MLKKSGRFSLYFFIFFGYRILDSLSCSFKSTVLVCSNYGNLREIQKQFPRSIFLNLKFIPDYIESHTLCTCLLALNLI